MSEKNYKYSIPEHFKAQWLTALRNGKYEQGTGQLCSRDGYCCLGVAAALCNIPEPDMEGLGYIYASEDAAQAFEEDAQDILTSTKLAYDNGYPLELMWKSEYNEGYSDDQRPLVATLSEMNDGGDTFEQIADWIEQNVEGYEQTIPAA